MNENETSALKLRLGFICILLWWFPFWAFAGQLSSVFGISTAEMTTILVVIQTAIGFIGFLIVGKPVAAIVKKTSFKKAPGIIVHAIIHGKIKEQE